jgi:hypothetical protein
MIMHCIRHALSMPVHPDSAPFPDFPYFRINE